jgi:pilus assembly protein CpaC
MRNFSSRTLGIVLLAAASPLRALAGGMHARDTSSPIPYSPSVTLANTEAPAGNLKLTVGHSLVLHTTTRLRRVYVSDPATLGSYVATPTQVMLTGKTPGTATVALWDGTGNGLLYTVECDLDVAPLARALQQALPGDVIAVRAQGARIELDGTVGSPEDAKQASEMAALYSGKVVNSLRVAYTHPRQVRLKVRIVEVDRTRLAQFGFNFFSAGKNTSSVSTQQFSSVGMLPGASSGTSLAVSSPLNLFFYNSSLNLGATIADLEAHNVLQILAEPTITSISGHEASFLSGGEFPYPVIQGGAGNFASVTIMFQPYGVKLRFTPSVNPDGTIRLKVAPEVSALDYTNAVTLSGYTIPAISTRRAETEVELRDGQSFSISGLLDHRTTVLLSQIPGIGNLPVLGRLFRSKNNTHSVEELVVIVTATIVDPLKPQPAPALPKMALPNMTEGAFDRSLTPAAAPRKP